jgi:flagellar motor switch protein FliM
MADILSQTEIDELLLAMAAGQPDELTTSASKGGQARPYDFRTANRIPRDQIKTLGLIHENYARLLTTFLTGTLGVSCECELASVEEQTYFEFTNSISASSLLALVKMVPLPGSVLLRISPESAHAMIESLLGGTGSRSAHHRAFTEIDLVILEKTIRQILPLVDEAWDKIAKISTQLEALETSLQFAHVASPSDAIAIITLKLTIGDVQSMINFCIPQPGLEPIAKSLNTSLMAAGRHARQPSESCEALLLRSLQPTGVTMRGLLSETTITVHELMNLQVGDVIQLDSKLDDPIGLMIGHIPRLTGTLGTLNRRYAIRVTGIHDEEAYAHE